ncbi:hypothetical protein FE251_10905 [Georgenia wutianyii]|uniref:ATPase n=1 Tax=Georgenia wutianyii TaxID=2585135 RepID=A0ABX5VMU2_9MICO|nr:hypothetical protein [Georgenia wutianyii]QDB79827.1 hypothetical protein FE251_10905 [Georgenia wutianyii]
MTAHGTTQPATQEDGASLLAILDELVTLVTEARQMPMSASVLVNRAEVMDLLAAAKSVVPGEIQAADDVLAGAEGVLAEARERAARVLREAEEQAERLVSEQSVVALAEERSAQIIAAAEEEAARLARNANDYCDRQLAQFEIDLGAITKQVRAGRDRLASLTDAPARD